MKYTQFVKQFRDDNKDLGMSFADCMKSDDVKKAFRELCGSPKIQQKDGNVNVILHIGEKGSDSDSDDESVPEDVLGNNYDRGQGKRPYTVTPGIPQRSTQVPPMAQTMYQSDMKTEPYIKSEYSPEETGRNLSMGDFKTPKKTPKSSSVQYVRRVGTDEREERRLQEAKDRGDYLDFATSPGLSTIRYQDPTYVEPDDEPVDDEPDLIQFDREFNGGGIINCCPAVRGGALKASDLRKLLASSYSGAPVDNWQMERDMSTNNSKVYRNPSTGQVVVAHKGTQGTTDWGNNLIYALTGEMGYRQTARFKEAQRVQKAAENAFGRDMVSTIGHSQGGLQAQMLGGDSKEIITVNKATRPGEVVTGSSKKKNQTDVRTSIDPVSAFRSPFASKKKSITLDADTKNPVEAHSYEALEQLGDEMIGEGIAETVMAKFERDWKKKLWDGKFNVPGEWDQDKKTWTNVKAYRAALARMEPERKKAYKMIKVRLDRDRDAEAKLAIKQKKSQKGRF